MKKLTANLTRDLAVGRALGEGVPIKDIATTYGFSQKRVYQLRSALLNEICVKAGRPELFPVLRAKLTQRPIMFLRLVEQYAQEADSDAAQH